MYGGIGRVIVFHLSELKYDEEPSSIVWCYITGKAAGNVKYFDHSRK